MQVHLPTSLTITTLASQLFAVPLDLFSRLWARFTADSDFSLLC